MPWRVACPVSACFAEAAQPQHVADDVTELVAIAKAPSTGGKIPAAASGMSSRL